MSLRLCSTWPLEDIAKQKTPGEYLNGVFAGHGPNCDDESQNQTTQIQTTVHSKSDPKQLDIKHFLNNKLKKKKQIL